MKHVTKYQCLGCWTVRDREKDPCPSCHAVTECEAFWPTASAAEIRQMALERGKRIEELETMLGRANDTLLMVGLAVGPPLAIRITEFCDELRKVLEGEDIQ